MSSIRQPDEFSLQVVVRLLPQAVLTDEGELRETLQHTETAYRVQKLTKDRRHWVLVVQCERKSERAN